MFGIIIISLSNYVWLHVSTKTVIV